MRRFGFQQWLKENQSGENSAQMLIPENISMHVTMAVLFQVPLAWTRVANKKGWLTSTLLLSVSSCMDFFGGN